MRIIEPSQAHREHVKKTRHYKVTVLTLVLVLAAGVGALYFNRNQAAAPEPPAQNASTQAAQVVEPDSNKPKQFKIFSGAEFRDLYNGFAYPNTKEVNTPPPITGNVAADDRIRAIAIGRGYSLRSVPAAALDTVDGFPIQQRAKEPWLQLKAAALKDDINLDIVSSFRSPDEQRSIFLAQMGAAGVTAAEVAAGEADTEIDTILKVYSIPGYSRHHTGYTLDLQCGTSGLDSFISTPCFAWLSQNNYENAKVHGWIPSYPDGAGSQGPNPEQWEYVWVGLDAVYKSGP